MSDSEGQNKQRNRTIAKNQADREAASGARISIWAVFAALIVALIVLGIAWPWLNR